MKTGTVRIQLIKNVVDERYTNTPIINKKPTPIPQPNITFMFTFTFARM